MDCSLRQTPALRTIGEVLRPASSTGGGERRVGCQRPSRRRTQIPDHAGPKRPNGPENTSRIAICLHQDACAGPEWAWTVHSDSGSAHNRRSSPSSFVDRWRQEEGGSSAPWEKRGHQCPAATGLKFPTTQGRNALPAPPRRESTARRRSRPRARPSQADAERFAPARRESVRRRRTPPRTPPARPEGADCARSHPRLRSEPERAAQTRRRGAGGSESANRRAAPRGTAPKGAASRPASGLRRGSDPARGFPDTGRRRRILRVRMSDRGPPSERSLIRARPRPLDRFGSQPIEPPAVK